MSYTPLQAMGLPDYGRYPEELAHPADGADRACRICGQLRPRKDPESSWVLDGPLDPSGPRATVRDEDGQSMSVVREDQPWRWRHTACTPEATTVVRGVLGIEVSEEDAAGAVDVAEITIARHENTTARKPWAFVTDEQRKDLRAELDRLALNRLARRHATGRCGWCGRSESVQWYVSGLTWAGTDDPAPLCTTCSVARVEGLRLHGDDGLRRVAMRQFAGLADTFGETRDYRFKFAAEVLPADHRHDRDAGAWTYSPTLTTVRNRAYLSEAGAIIDPLQREFRLKILAEKLKRANADREAAEAAEDGEPDTW